MRPRHRSTAAAARTHAGHRTAADGAAADNGSAATPPPSADTARGASRHRRGCSRERAARSPPRVRRSPRRAPSRRQPRPPRRRRRHRRRHHRQSPAKDAEATQRLDIAKAEAGQQPGRSGGCRPAADHAGLPGHAAFGVDAAFLAGEALEKAGRDEDAMAAYVEFDRRFPSHPRMRRESAAPREIDAALEGPGAPGRGVHAARDDRPQLSRDAARPSRHCWRSGRSRDSGDSCAPPIRC